ncbi:Cupredoxin [Delitschia confertaspora ATCC 74209]|uniref:Cupredoxin n=1 Tax=Delitschia confertaspora ATCC 74209 TaxID=1513339 RepID=A0A9P4JPX8_9PLEO|nr:Cupredoxin [Delitschia confertaspora ATCC 74209]
MAEELKHSNSISRTYTHPDTGKVIDYYDITIKPFEKQVYPNLGAAPMVGYDGMSPGPTFIMQQGREAVVRFSNQGTKDISVHVHGQYNRAPFDGWASDLAKIGEYKDYYYPNAQNARTIWYHDHAEYSTADGAYHGQAGFYILTDSHESSLGLPSGDYDVALGIESKLYNSDGALLFETNDNAGLWGDVIQVNGQPWPYLNVEPRKYRLRMLNGAISRAFNLSLTVGDPPEAVPFNVISSDCGLLSKPIPSSTLFMSMGERYDIIVDFSGLQGQNVTLENGKAVGDSPDYAATDRVMRFVVGDEVTNWDNNDDLPSTLREIPSPPNDSMADKDFTFERDTAGNWLINGIGFADVDNRILTKTPRGSVETWILKNGGVGTHPVHVHLVDFQIISREGGRDEVLPYESAGMKDTVYVSGGETVKVFARYAPWDGVYMFHCHNLIHEDHDMLTAMNISQLSEWGYDNSTHFIDPMEPQFRPKTITDDDFTEDAIMDKLQWFYDQDAYDHGNVSELVSSLDAYWADGGATSSATASAETSVNKITITTSSSASGSLAETSLATSSVAEGESGVASSTTDSATLRSDTAEKSATTDSATKSNTPTSTSEERSAATTEKRSLEFRTTPTPSTLQTRSRAIQGITRVAPSI